MSSEPETNTMRERGQATLTEQRVAWLESNIRLLLNTISDGANCKGCDAPIWWVPTKKGKRAPFTSEGLNHFADCPAKDRFR